MPPVVDLSGVETRQFTALPPCTVRAVVDRSELRVSAAGNDNVMWVFKVTDVLKMRDDAPEGFVGRTFVHGTSLTKDSLWNLLRTLAALGEDPIKLQGQLDINDEYLTQFIGREAIVQLGKREYQGQDQNNVQNIRALTAEESSKLL